MASTSTLTTMKQIRDNIASTVLDTQIGNIIDTYINLTGLEIHGFAPWTWKRRKQTFVTVADQEDYNLDSEVDEIAILRDRTNNVRLRYLPDDLFYRFIANPEDTGSGVSRYYRRWEETGFATNLAAADTVYVNSSSTSDGSDFTVRIRGRNSSGEPVEETLTLNGTTNVTSTTTFAAAGLMQIAKSAPTTGTITCYRTTGATQLTELEPNNLAPRFKRIGLYPIPSAVVTLYLEYWDRYRYLLHDTDIPQLDSKWNWVLREGALAKTWEYKQKPDRFLLHQTIFEKALKRMLAQDSVNQDYVPELEPRDTGLAGVVRRDNDSVSNNFPSYSLRF